MVDLDSNPTKLIEVVEIGKQLLMTRGALTTFSIANDVAKYFAIIPAAFATTYPALNALNVMHLATPESAILLAVIFNALIIIALIPLALRGIEYRAVGASLLLRREPARLRPRRHHRPVRRDQGHRRHPRRPAPRLNGAPPCSPSSAPPSSSLARPHRPHGGRLPAPRHRDRAGGVPAAGEREPHRARTARRSARRSSGSRSTTRSTSGAASRRRRTPTASRSRTTRGASVALEPRPDQPRARRRGQGAHRRAPRRRSRTPGRPSRSTS